ncbi:MAG: hypothetical protein ACI8PZ_002724 [Myxococcota bacterium]|jgi:hypothetical protein
MTRTLAALVLAGCTSGRINWADGTTEVRSALYRVGLDAGIPSASVFLTNGEIGCSLPSTDDPVTQEDAVQDLFLAMCREDARHVHLLLWRHPDSQEWTATYPARREASAAALSGRRLARGATYGVGEAYRVELPGVPRGYAAEDLDVRPDLGRGEVEVIEHGDRLDGSFSFPEAKVSGRFRATQCLDDTSLLDVVEAGPTFLCP